LDLNFKSVKSPYNEELTEKFLPNEFVIKNAFLKAYYLEAAYPKTLVIGFDTIVECQNNILGKPKNKKNAIEMLQFLSDKTHNVLTGYAFIDKLFDFKLEKYVSTSVTFKKLSKAEINWYIDTGEPFDKAGSYAIQGIGSFLIKKINGSYSNVVGLPIAEFLEDLKYYKEKLYEYKK